MTEPNTAAPAAEAGQPDDDGSTVVVLVDDDGAVHYTARGSVFARDGIANGTLHPYPPEQAVSTEGQGGEPAEPVAPTDPAKQPQGRQPAAVPSPPASSSGVAGTGDASVS